MSTRAVTVLPHWRVCLDDVTSASVLLQDAGVVSPLLHALDSALPFRAGQECVQAFGPLPHPAVNQTRLTQKPARQRDREASAKARGAPTAGKTRR